LRKKNRFAQTVSGTGLLEQETNRLLRCLSPLGEIDLGDRTVWDLRLTEIEVARAMKALERLQGRPFIAVNIGGKVAVKNWGDDNWKSLLRSVADKYEGYGLALFGSDDEWDRCEEVGSVWSGPALNLCGALTPRQAAAALRGAVLFIGQDSGPMHLAAAANVPCVCVFGNYNAPRRWHPYGRHHRIIHNMKGVGGVSQEEVLAAVHSVFDNEKLRAPQLDFALG
jgi:ADP-heptose:LPS heptosyltransferase